jgi:chromosome segregation ATPase
MMQTAEFLVTKHDEQIAEIKTSLGEITTKITVMISEHSHLSKKVEEVLEAVKTFHASKYDLLNIQNQLTALEIKVKKLEEEAQIESDRIKHVEQKTNRFSNLMVVLKDYWPIILVLLAGLATLIDWVYKLDPPH